MTGSLDLRERIAAAVATRDDDALATALLSGTHHGKPGVNAATKEWVARQLIERDGAGSSVLLETALRLAVAPPAVMRSLACVLLAGLWSTHRMPAYEAALRLAADVDWEVREWAAGIFATALDQQFNDEYQTMRALVSHAEPGVRRASSLAAMRAANKRKPERAAPLLALLEPLLADRDPYVRRNLGPFAFGSLITAYPTGTWRALAAWAARDDATTRWNVAMACGTAAAARHPNHARAILASLDHDDRHLVRGAVAAARRKLDRRNQPDT